MRELGKTIFRRSNSFNFQNKYFCGIGIDVGAGQDSLEIYKEFFLKIKKIRSWDVDDGDATFLKDIPNNSFDFLNSSHCLEHLNNPLLALENWLRVVKENGYVVVTLPDEELYEQGNFPSKFNADHKYSYSIFNNVKSHKKSINLLDLFKKIKNNFKIIKIERFDINYRYNYPIFDQTILSNCEVGIEFILQKSKSEEIFRKQPKKIIKKYINQQISDRIFLKKQNKIFQDESDI